MHRCHQTSSVQSGYLYIASNKHGCIVHVLQEQCRDNSLNRHVSVLRLPRACAELVVGELLDTESHGVGDSCYSGRYPSLF